jgi:hypothetical protein
MDNRAGMDDCTNSLIIEIIIIIIILLIYFTTCPLDPKYRVIDVY